MARRRASDGMLGLHKTTIVKTTTTRIGWRIGRGM
jgi:hypothetical protein